MRPLMIRLGMLTGMLLAFLTTSAYDFEVDGIFYNFVSASDLTCKVTAGDDTDKYGGDIIIPSKVKFQNKELSVVEVGDKCFERCTDLTSVQIPSSVTRLGSMSFYGCTGLTSIQRPSSVTSLGDNCFSFCKRLTSVQIPSSVNKLGYYCFSDCSGLTSVQISSSITEIPDGCFAQCGNLVSVQIPSSVTTLDNSCFYRCGNLVSVQIPSSVKSIGKSCFSYCYELTSIYLPSSVKSMGTECFEDCSKLSSVVSNVEYIPESAFSGTSIVDLKIGEGTKLICVSSGRAEYPTFPKGIKKIEFEEQEDEISIGYYDRYGAFTLDPDPDLARYGFFKETWAEDLEILFLGTTLKGIPLICPNLKELTIGAKVDRLGLGSNNGYTSTTYETLDLGYFSQLVTLKSLNPIPPNIGKPTQMQYVNLEVEVPEEALEAYKSDPVWGSFWNLKGVSGTKTVSSTPEREVTGYYDLSGRQVDETFSGMVIVRFSDGSAKKMMWR